jgi:uncharacterized protein (DUF1697 family)
MPQPTTTEVHVALLRGINVGGKNRLPMAALVAAFTAAGCQDVRTYIQSGNVVFRARRGVVKGLASQVESAISRSFGFRAPVVLRAADELLEVREGNPFLAEGEPPQALHVAFLADLPSPARVAALDPQRSPPDRFQVRGREVYLCCPQGMARTKLTTSWLDAALGTTATVRNWNTVCALSDWAMDR